MPAAFKLYPTFQTFFSDDGTLLAGGYLKFLAAGTSNTKNVYGEKALSTNNGYLVDLDASGRPDVEIWGSGQYDVELYDTDDVKVGEDLLVEVSGGEATALPALVADQFLTNDGGTMSWAEVRELPDPSGNADKVLSTDGTVFTWIAAPVDGAAGAAGTSDITQTATTVQMNDMLIQAGTGTGVSVAGRTQSVSITFGTAFTSTPIFVDVCVTSSSLSSYGNMPSHAVTAKSTTGFTVVFTMGELDDSQGGYNFNAGVAFMWTAMGVNTA